VLSAQDGASFAWDDNSEPTDFDNGDNEQASNFANGSSQSPSFVTEYQDGEFAVASNDQATAFTGWAANGVYIQGPDGPACSFIGHLVLEPLNPSS
jgi:hypothetical protein